MAARETRTASPSRPGARRQGARALTVLALVLALLGALVAIAAAGALMPAFASSPTAAMAMGPRFDAADTGRPPVYDRSYRSLSPFAPSHWLSFSALAGSTQPDRGLADYQWDTTPHLAWGMKAMAGAGRFGAGLRLWRTRTTQDLGVASESDPAVHSTSLELIGSARLASVWGVDLTANGGGGWLRLAYDPEETTIDTGGGSTVVRFAPIDEVIWGAGFAARRALAGPWGLGLEVDRRAFALDTSHRSGSTIVSERTPFAEWSARMELSWTRGW